MAAKNSTKSSKTAHVMNLLNKGRAHTPDGDAPSSGEASNGSPLDEMVDQPTTDQMISDQIKGALEEELGDVSAPAPQQAPVPEPTTAEPEPVTAQAPPPPEPIPTPADEPAPMPADEGAVLEESAASATPPPPPDPAPVAEVVTTPEPQPVSIEDPAPTPESQPAPVEDAPPAPAPPQAPLEEVPMPPEDAATSSPPAETQPEDSTTQAQKEINCINVMQVLVEERAQKYIDMFGLCQCPRCVVDVKALALSNLPAKYVVMNKGEMVPRITIYESRYSTAITAQIMQACKIVMDSPRHDM